MWKKPRKNKKKVFNGQIQVFFNMDCELPITSSIQVNGYAYSLKLRNYKSNNCLKTLKMAIFLTKNWQKDGKSMALKCQNYHLSHEYMLLSLGCVKVIEIHLYLKVKKTCRLNDPNP